MDDEQTLEDARLVSDQMIMLEVQDIQTGRWPAEQLVKEAELTDERSRVKGSVLEMTRVVEPGLTGTRHAFLLLLISSCCCCVRAQRREEPRERVGAGDDPCGRARPHR